VLGAIVLFWLAVFFGLAAVGLLLELLALPWRIAAAVGSVAHAAATELGASAVGAWNAIARRRQTGGVGRAAQAIEVDHMPRPGDADYLEWANREGRYADREKSAPGAL
jgi:hypothetical protein